MKLFHRDPPPRQVHYTIYKGWWIEERKSKSSTGWEDPVPRYMMPEYRIYPDLRAATSGENRGPVKSSLGSAQDMITKWGQRGYVVQHFLRKD